MYDLDVAKNVDSATELDSRLEMQLWRPLDTLEWRVDLTWRPDRDSRSWLGEPFLVVASPPRGVTYEPLKTRRLPEAFRLLASTVYPDPPATWFDSDAETKWSREWSDPAKRIAAQGAILTFANRFGFLRGAGPLVGQAGAVSTFGEPLSYWLGELCGFRWLLALVDGLRSAPRGQLQGLKFNDLVGRLPSNNDFYLDVSGLKLRERRAAVDRYCRIFVRHRISVSPAPLEDDKPLRFSPTSVLSAVYLDLAMEMVKSPGARVRECEWCHKFFGTKRRDTRFCGDTCRSNANYHASKERNQTHE